VNELERESLGFIFHGTLAIEAYGARCFGHLQKTAPIALVPYILLDTARPPHFS
jgi:hypothetical protein